MADLYNDLENVPFPEEAIKRLLWPAQADAVMNIVGALQFPFATILLTLVSLATFRLHRTVAIRFSFGWCTWDARGMVKSLCVVEQATHPGALEASHTQN